MCCPCISLSAYASLCHLPTFQNWHFGLVSPPIGPATEFLLTGNYVPISAGTFQWNFIVYYFGFLQYVIDPVSGNVIPQSTPPPPTGTCELL